MTQQPMYPAQPDSPDFTLAADITSPSQTSIDFEDLTGLLAAPNTITIRQDDSDTTPETMYYAVDPVGTTLVVTRGYGGTAAKTFTAGALACRAHTALDLNTVQANINDLVSSLSGYAVDSAVFHKATAAEINALTLKASPVAADVLMIEDSAESFNKKKIAVSTLPFQTILTNPVTGPGSGVTVGHLAVMNNTSGTEIADGGEIPVVPAFDSTATNIKMNGVQAAGSTGLIPNSDHVHPTDTSRAAVPLVLGTPTLTSLQDFLNGTGSGGRIYGGVITDAGSGLINISALKGFIVTADYSLGVDSPATIRFFDLAAQTNWGGSGTGTTLTTDSINYIYVDYNSGTPVVKCTTDRSTIRMTDQFTIGRVFKIDATTLEVLTSGVNIYDRVRLTHEKWIDTFGALSYANGLIVSTTAGSGGTTPNLGPRPAFTAGTLYAGSNKISLTAVDCNAGGTFTKFYYNPTGAAWVKVTGLNQLDNLNYNDTVSGTGLVALTINRYGVHWIYICPEGAIYIVMGQGDYTLAQAQAAAVPTLLPNYISQWCVLAAKVIVQKSSTTAQEIDIAWSTAFPVSNPTDHNSLAGLQGGTSAQYYHLTADQHIALTNAWADFSPSLTWGTADPTISSTVSRYCRTGNTVKFTISLVISNGNAASSLTVSLPVAAPQTANYYFPLIGFKKITSGGSSLMSDPFAYIDYTEATPVIKFSQFGTLPSGYTAELRISGSYEVT